jgi:hypothetical protein
MKSIMIMLNVTEIFPMLFSYLLKESPDRIKIQDLEVSLHDLSFAIIKGIGQNFYVTVGYQNTRFSRGPSPTFFSKISLQENLSFFNDLKWPIFHERTFRRP